MHFNSPIFLWLSPFWIAILFYIGLKRKKTGIIFSSEKFLNFKKTSLKEYFSKYLWIINILVLFFINIGLARPQLFLESSKVNTEGIDIMLVLDTSTSMLAEDFTLESKRANRLEVAKKVVESFIEKRKNDRIGIIAFAARAYLVSPLTLDYSWLLENLKRVKIGIIEDGTAIGSAITVALKHLKNSSAKTKIIILLTDGVNNAGKISPLLASEMASVLKVKIYTIGIGTKGLAPYPVKDIFGNTVYQQIKVEIDEEALINIAKKTEGRYFRATDTFSLKEIYNEIDRLEKTPLEDKGYQEHKELFPIFVKIAMGLLFIYVLINETILRVLP